MQIGRVKVRKRTVRIEPRRCSEVSQREADGNSVLFVSVSSAEKSFLPWQRTAQSDELWVGHCSGGLSPVAVIAESKLHQERQLQEEASKKEHRDLASFFIDAPDEKKHQSQSHIVVRMEYSLEAKGRWIGKRERFVEEFITVLERTKVSMKLKDKEIKMLLKPGTVAMISPFPIPKNPSGSTDIKTNRASALWEIGYVLDSIASSKTPEELARRLNLDPARLQSSLVEEER